MPRRIAVAALLVGAAFPLAWPRSAALDAAQPRRPNFIVFLTDDQGEVAADRPSDGYDLRAFLTDHAPTPRHELYYIADHDLQAIREGRWKLRIAPDIPQPGLYDLDRDPGERFDVASASPEIVARLRERLDRFRSQLPPAAR